MKTIYRYEVPLFDTVTHALTGDPLHVAESPTSGSLEFWAEFDPSEISTRRSFTVIGTGHTVLPNMKYIGTAPRTAEGFVWHLYEV